MLEPIISHQKTLKEIEKKMNFLRENFDFSQKAFYEELFDLAEEMEKELEYHFNLQIYSYGENQKAKKFVLENMLVRDILFRMLKFIKSKAKENSMDAFLKFDDFEEIFNAYLKKEKGLFRQQLKSVLSEEEINDLEERLSKLI